MGLDHYLKSGIIHDSKIKHLCGAGTAQWLVPQTGSSLIERSRVRVPAGAAGESSSQYSQLSVLLFWYPFGIPVWYRSGSRSFCQKCRRQATETRMRPMDLSLHEVTWHGAQFYGVHSTRRDGSSFIRHQPCNNQNRSVTEYTRLPDGYIQNAL